MNYNDVCVELHGFLFVGLFSLKITQRFFGSSSVTLGLDACLRAP